MDLSNCEDREKKLAELPNKPSKKSKKTSKSTDTSKSKKTSKSKRTSKFKVGDYVLSRYPNYGDQWFRCEVYGKYRGKYNIYFLVDGATLKQVDEGTLREPEPGAPWTKLKREDYFNKPFLPTNPKLGKWKAVGVGKGRKANNYKCVPWIHVPDPDDPYDDEPVIHWLDVGQVQEFIRRYESSS